MFVSIAFAQPTGVGIEVRLVSNQAMSDPGLNAILSLHQVNHLEIKGGHPYPDYNMRTIQIDDADNFSTLLSDLLAYPSAVEYAEIIDAGVFAQCCNVQLVSSNIGIPSGFADNIVVTNDIGLNLIFQNFNVYYYTQTYPSSTWESSLRYYSIVCDCNSDLLRDALNNYTQVIQTAGVAPAAYLKVEDYQNPKVSVYPNPFSTNLMIDSSIKIQNYGLVDLSGKVLLKTHSFSDIQNQLEQLQAGVYFIRLQFENNKFQTKKVIKL